MVIQSHYGKGTAYNPKSVGAEPDHVFSRSLVAGVAHEINNPVNFIYGNVVYAKEYALDLTRLVNLYSQHCPQAVPEIEAATDEIDIEFIAADLHKLLDSMKLRAERIRNIVLSLRAISPAWMRMG